jgi:alkylation response protein AidB-like acyl-CoA dehydrogenase
MKSLTAEFDAALRPEERDLIARAAAFADAEVTPNAARWEWERTHPTATLRKACAEGLHMVELAPQHGGHGFSYACKMRMVEEMAKRDYGFAFSFINHANAMTRLARDGQPTLVARLLPRMLSGEVIGCAGLTEPGAGSDFGAIASSARKVEGGWKLDGAKAWIANGALCGLSAAYAQTDPAKGWKGIACFAVEAERPGFARAEPYGLHGGHALGVGGFSFTDYFAADDALLQPPGGDAFKRAMAGINGARVYVAAMCCGMIEESLRVATKYGGERKTFGQPLIEHQGWRWKLVDVATQLEALRALTYRAARTIVAGEDALLPAAYCKKMAGDVTVGAIAACIQAMGANGMRSEFPLMRHLAGAKIGAYTDGSTEIQNERIGRELSALYA